MTKNAFIYLFTLICFVSLYWNLPLFLQAIALLLSWGSLRQAFSAAASTRWEHCVVQLLPYYTILYSSICLVSIFSLSSLHDLTRTCVSLMLGWGGGGKLIPPALACCLEGKVCNWAGWGWIHWETSPVSVLEGVVTSLLCSITPVSSACRSLSLCFAGAVFVLKQFIHQVFCFAPKYYLQDLYSWGCNPRSAYLGVSVLVTK